MFGLKFADFPEVTTSIEVVDDPYPAPELAIFTEIIFPIEFNSGISTAPVPIPRTLISGAVL